MPTIFSNIKKKMAPVAVKAEDGAVKEDLSEHKALAGEILKAIRDGSEDGLASALKAFYAECEKYEDD